ncbi:MAG: TetR/AcrR family transcriptional regulator [Spirosomaceae bacterium]|jgi:AcrR family transcriptional regulator|nr:TetR/AcrR family transcriptional regulator [Spirosomataceae bacterium]
MRTKDEEKERLILESALSIIAKTGLAGLRMSDLAKEAKLATGTVYIYFKDKDQLVRKLYLYLMRTTTSDLSSGIQPDDSIKSKIKKISHNYLLDSILKPQKSIFFEQYFRSPFFHETESVLNEEDQILQPIYQLVLEGQRQDIIKKVNPDLIVTIVCGMLESVAKTAVYTDKIVSDSEWELIFGIVWDAIKS